MIPTEPIGSIPRPPALLEAIERTYSDTGDCLRRRLVAFAAFLDAVHPDDRRIVAAMCARSLRHRDDFDNQFRIRRPGGSVRWVATKGKVFSDEARPQYMTGASADVSRRKAREESLREETRTLEVLNDVIRTPAAGRN